MDHWHVLAVEGLWMIELAPKGDLDLNRLPVWHGSKGHVMKSMKDYYKAGSVAIWPALPSNMGRIELYTLVLGVWCKVEFSINTLKGE